MNNGISRQIFSSLNQGVAKDEKVRYMYMLNEVVESCRMIHIGLFILHSLKVM